MLRTSRKPAYDAREARLRALMVAALAGDAVAYRTFLRELAAHLRRFLGGRLHGRPDDVEDLVQECLIAVHDKRHTYDTAQPLTPWIHAIACYKLADHLRRGATANTVHADFDDEPDLRPWRGPDAADAKHDLATLLARLPDRQRLPILHVKLEGLSVAEAAGITGMSASAVKIGIHRGLKALAAMIGRRA
jgi:RNA polymerase sigma-70 factor (ECF subfamily)